MARLPPVVEKNKLIHDNDSPIREALRTMKEALQQAVATMASAGSCFEERESLALQISNETARCVLQEDLQQLADEHSDRLLINGDEYRRHTTGTVEYHSLCGGLWVQRSTYRLCGRIKRRGRSYQRQAKSVVPLEFAAGLVMTATPALGYSIAHAYAGGPMRHYVEEMGAAHRRVPPRATLERLATGIGGMARQDVMKIEPCIRKAERVPEHSHAVVVGIDRTSTPMIEERPPGQLPNSERKSRKRPYVRRPPSPFDVVYRMAYVGTVTLIGEDGESLITRRYAATAEEGPDELVARMMADVSHCITQRPALSVAVVQDGAPELWNLIRTALRKTGIKKWRSLIDFYHVTERIGAMLELVIKNKVERAEQLTRWKKRLLASDYAMPHFLRYVQQRRPKRGSQASKSFLDHEGYLAGYYTGGKFKYCSARNNNIPIGSGITEGSCKSLFAARVKRSGQRWYHDGLTAVLTLRALRQSDRLRSFWRHFRRRFEANVQLAA